jgi:hypothetical protein
MFSIAGGIKSGTSWTPTYGKLRITGITFRGRDPNSITGDSAIYIISCKDFRVDHCTFYDMGASGVNVCDQGAQYGVTQWNTNDPSSTPLAQRNGGDPIRISQGVIDHCGFYDIYKPASTQANIGWGYGIWVRRAEHYWWIYWDEDIWSLFGKYNNNVFIEDNYFRGCRHVVASIGGGVYVFRHNVVEDLRIYEASTTGHPVRDNIYGMRANEMYDNVFRYTGTYGTKFLGPLWKGGGGLYHNNTIENMIDAIEIGNCEANNVFYPRGNIKDLYIWGNTVINCDIGLYQQNPYSSGGWTAPLAIEGTDFFSDMTGTYTTQQISNMVTANGYTPYPYPHPLALAT